MFRRSSSGDIRLQLQQQAHETKPKPKRSRAPVPKEKAPKEKAPPATKRGQKTSTKTRSKAMRSSLAILLKAKHSLDVTASRCVAGEARRLLTHRLLSLLSEYFDGQSQDDAKPMLLLGGVDALRYVVRDFEATMERLTTVAPQSFDGKKGSASGAWVAKMQQAMYEFRDAVLASGGDMRVSVMVPARRQAAEYNRVSQVVGILLGRLRASIMADEDGEWAHLLACMRGALPLLRTPGSHADEPSAPCVATSHRADPAVRKLMAEAAADMHLSTYELDSSSISSSRRSHTTVYKMRMGYSLPADDALLAATDVVTVSVPHADDAGFADLMNDNSNNVMRVSIQTSDLSFHTYSLRSAARNIAALLDVYAVPVTGVAAPQHERHFLRHLTALCYVQMIRCVLDVMRQSSSNVVKQPPSAKQGGAQVVADPPPAVQSNSVKPVDAAANVKPIGAEANVKPVGAAANVKPVSAEANVKPVGAAANKNSPNNPTPFAAAAAQQSNSKATDGFMATVGARFSAIDAQLQAQAKSHRSFAAAMQVVERYQELAYSTMQVVADLCSSNEAVGNMCMSMLRKYQDAETTPQSLLLCGGGGGSADPEHMTGGRNKQGKTGSGKGRGRGNNGSSGKGRGRGNNDTRKNNNGEKGKGKKNQTDSDVMLAMSPECAAHKPDEKMKDLQVLAEWYATLRRALEESVKKALDETADANKAAMKCIPLSVKDKVRSIKTFIDDLSDYYMHRLTQLYTETYKQFAIDADRTGIFVDAEGNLFTDLKGQEAMLTQKFESKQLLYKFKNIWHDIINNNLEKMREVARGGLRNHEPSPMFRHAYYNPKRDKFWFLWTANSPELKNNLVTVVEMTVDTSKSSDMVKLEAISFPVAMAAGQEERLVRLSMTDTHAIEFIHKNK